MCYVYCNVFREHVRLVQFAHKVIQSTTGTKNNNIINNIGQSGAAMGRNAPFRNAFCSLSQCAPQSSFHSRTIIVTIVIIAVIIIFTIDVSAPFGWELSHGRGKHVCVSVCMDFNRMPHFDWLINSNMNSSSPPTSCGVGLVLFDGKHGNHASQLGDGWRWLAGSRHRVIDTTQRHTTD